MTAAEAVTVLVTDAAPIKPVSASHVAARLVLDMAFPPLRRPREQGPAVRQEDSVPDPVIPRTTRTAPNV
ncbi:hypothetical protein GCM10010492_09600 [Saccharothrix mutabilis subsp. mutabilis]|uniref:Uncharacterized protein n=1 Tax=Saccharothrix mutabilis subsp. mutabilis TaxID=66855 RepID=A0ABP3CRW4_9PSEU